MLKWNCTVYLISKHLYRIKNLHAYRKIFLLFCFLQGIAKCRSYRYQLFRLIVTQIELGCRARTRFLSWTLPGSCSATPSSTLRNQIIICCCSCCLSFNHISNWAEILAYSYIAAFYALQEVLYLKLCIPPCSNLVVSLYVYLRYFYSC